MTLIEIDAGTFEIKRTGTFDLDLLYKGMRKWFADRKYFFQENVHKFKPPELELEWEGKRKENAYRMIVTQMKFHSWYHKEVKVKVDGKEKKMVSARLQIKISTKVVYDYNNKWKTPFQQFLQKFLHKFVIFYYVFIVWPDKSYYELVDLQNKIKEYLDMTLKGGAFP